MTSWEDTEHPVVLFYQSGYEVEGMDILSLSVVVAEIESFPTAILVLWRNIFVQTCELP